MTVAQGAVYTDTIGPIIDASGAVVSNAVSAGQLTIIALYDSGGTDQSGGSTLIYLGNGVYQVSKTLSGSAALGNWTLLAAWNNTVEPVRRYSGTFQVVTEQQADPMASARGAKLDLLGQGLTTITAPVASGGDVTIIAGDDYLNVDGRALAWTSTTWPALTSGSAILTIKAQGIVALTKTMTVVDASHVRVDLTKTDTAPLGSGGYRLAVVATLADASIVTLVNAGLSVQKAGV